MKNKLFVFITSMLLTHIAFAQNKFSNLSIGIGISTSNSKFSSFDWETSKNGYFSYGLAIDAIGYSYHREKYNLKWNKIIIAGGGFAKFEIANGKNFKSNFFIGAMGGSDNSKFIFYPYGGFEEAKYLSPKIQVFMSEKVLYFFNEENSWQPLFSLGFKINL